MRRLTGVLLAGLAVAVGGCSSSGSVPQAGPSPSELAVIPAIPAGPTSDLCKALTYAAPAASKLLRSQRAFSGASIQPGVKLPSVAGQLRCLAPNDAVGVTADGCISLLQGVNVSVYDTKAGGTPAATHPLAHQVVADRYDVELNLGGFASKPADAKENGSDPVCAEDAALAEEILVQVLRYYRPAAIH